MTSTSSSTAIPPVPQAAQSNASLPPTPSAIQSSTSSGTAVNSQSAAHRLSYSQAAGKKTAPSTTIVSSTLVPPTQSPVASSPVVGGSQNVRPGANTSPVNGKTSIPPAVPAVVTTSTTVNNGTTVNGSSTPSSAHSRKSSLASGPSGQSWQQQNGIRMPPAPGQPPAGPSPIQFGSINQNSSASTGITMSPALTANLPVNSAHTGSTSTTTISPHASPVPSGQPIVSGGPPPQLPRSGMPTFGSMNETPAEQLNRNMNQQTALTMPPTAPMGASGGSHANHMRRDSSHGENIPSGLGPAGRGMTQPVRGGRHNGPGGYNNYGQHPAHNPYTPSGFTSTQPYRNNQGAGRGISGPPYSGNNAPITGFANNRGGNGGRSPALTHSLPSTPQIPSAQLSGGNPPMQSPQFGYAQHLSPHSSMSSMPPMGFSQDYGSYYNPQGNFMSYNHGSFLPQSGSPRPSFQPIQHAQPNPYHVNQFQQQPQSMSRSGSQISEHVARPPSGMAHLHTPTLSSASIIPPPLVHPGPTAPVSNNATSNIFKKVEKSKKIEIRDPTTGAIRSFNKAPQSTTPPRPTGSPVIVSSSFGADHPERSNSRGNVKSPLNTSGKSDQEVRDEIRAAVEKKLQADKLAEKRQAEEEAAKKAEEERLAKEAEEQRIQKEEEDRVARLAKEKEAEEAAQKAEEEAKAKAEAEAEAKALEEEEAERKKNEEEEARRLKEAEDRVAAEKVEEETKAKAKADREAAEAAEKESSPNDSVVQTSESVSNDQDMSSNQLPSTPEVVHEAAKDAEDAVATSKPIAPDARAVEELASDIAKISVSATSPSSGTPDALAAVKPLEKTRKPAPLNLQLKTTSEPALPSAALTALKSARFINDINSVAYPSSIMSPNPAINTNAPGGKFKYEKDFLMQFQGVFVEKPSVDWDSRMRDVMGETESARPVSARAPSMGPKSASRPGGGMPPPQQGMMGSFGKMGGANILAAAGRQPSNSFMGPGGLGSMSNFRPAPLIRTGSSTALANQANATPQSPGGRVRSVRGQNKRNQGPGNMDNRTDSRKSARDGDSMGSASLVAPSDVKPLEVSKTRWQPRSVQAAAAVGPGAPGGPPAPGTDNDGRLPPEMVQRKVKAALNKMTPEKFDKIADQILEIASQSRHESDGRSLRQVIQLTFEKATDEPNFSSMYAKFCKRMLDDMDPEIKDENIKDKTGKVVTGGALFRKYLLNRCQEEFERGWKVNLPPKPDGESEEAVMLSDEYYIAMAAKRRGLGLIQFIGELFKLSMLTERIMHECMKKLVDFEGVPEEEEVESLVKLLRTIGKALDSTDKSKPMMDIYFDRIKKTMEIKDLPSRLHFLFLEIVELRRLGWQSKEDNKGPKTIAEIHEEVAKEAAEKEAASVNARANAQRRPALGRGDSRAFSQLGNMGFNDQRQSQTLGTDDLRKLGSKSIRTSVISGAGPMFGPSTSFVRSGSSGSKKGLGPVSFGNTDSTASSRTATPPTSQRESLASMNSFQALLGHSDQTESSEPQEPSSDKPTISEVKTSTDTESA